MNAQGASVAGVTDSNPDSVTFTDPWEALDDGVEHRDSWLLSYIDILTLFLTLFVVLLVLQPNDEAPPIDADPGEYQQFSLQQVEHQSLPHAAVTLVESQQATGSGATDHNPTNTDDSANGMLVTDNPAEIAPQTDTARLQSDQSIFDVSIVEGLSATALLQPDLLLVDFPTTAGQSATALLLPDLLAIDIPVAEPHSAIAPPQPALPTSDVPFVEGLSATSSPQPDLLPIDLSVAEDQSANALPQPDLPTIDIPVAEHQSAEDSGNQLDIASANSIASGDEPASAQLPQPEVELLSASGQSNDDLMHRFMTELTQAELEKKVKVSLLAEGVYLEVQDNVLFALGSAELKTEGENLLNKLATIFQKHRGIVSVEGHTDNQPIANARFPSNWELSTGRATTVTRHLVGKGLDPARLRAVGYADTRPLESNATAAGRSRNRRVALIVNLHEN